MYIKGQSLALGLKQVERFLKRNSFSSDVSLHSFRVMSMQDSSSIKWYEYMKCIYIWLL